MLYPLTITKTHPKTMKKLFLFLFCNVIFSSIISIKYFLVPGAIFTTTGIVFAGFAVIGQFFLFYLLLSIICIPFFIRIFFIPRGIQNMILSILFGLCQIMLYVDVLTFEQYRFHVNQSVLSLVLSGQVVDFSLMAYVIMGCLILVVLFIEFAVLWLLDRYLNGNKSKKKIKKVIKSGLAFVIFALIATNLTYMVSSFYSYSPVLVMKEYIPYYYPLTSNKIMRFIDKDGEKEGNVEKINYNSSVDYPKEPLDINQNIKPYNIIIIGLDSWRYDTYNQDISPNTYRFVQKHNGISFNNHYSTGNATRAGIFGLFYGIPATYWQSFYNSRIPSQFITTLQKQNYNIGIFFSAKVTAPEFDQTAFATVKDLRIGSRADNTPERDKELTQDWLKWHKNRDSSRPSFSFLFYDGPHSFQSLKEVEKKFQPADEINYLKLNNDTDPTPYINQYKNSVYSDDYLLQQVYDELEKSGELDNTLIIITADHGQEINDNKLGYWGHNGNFTDVQTKVPFIVIEPKGENRKELLTNAENNVLTSHQDVVPSLMKHYLGVKNDIRDYSTGYDLFSPIKDRNWLLISSYSTYGIITDNNIYYVNSVGMASYLDKHNRAVDDKPNYKYIKDALQEMTYFYQH